MFHFFLKLLEHIVDHLGRRSNRRVPPLPFTMPPTTRGRSQLPPPATIADTAPATIQSNSTITTESAINRDHPPPLCSPTSTGSDPPALVDVSSSDSDSDFDYTSCHRPTYSMMSITEYQQASTTKPLVLTPGMVSPEQLCMWEMGCLQYFHHKMISAADQIQYVVWGLHDPRIQQWCAIDAGHLNALDFTSFMAELRDYWLPTDWATDLRLKMLSSHQGSHPFHEWVINVQTQNAMLTNHDGHMMAT